MSVGRRRLFGIVLTVSLAINLFAVGILIGVVAIGGGHFVRRGFDPAASGFHASPAFMALEAESRQLAIEKFQENEQALRDETRAFRVAQRNVVRALSAEPFDPAAAADALRDLRQRGDAIQAVIHGNLIAISRDLSAEERRRLSRSIFRSPAYRMPLARGEPAPHLRAG
ncbi:MAG: periplasmic heavy metal sensor [Alphaproteobacteria bacterium]|nr:periplasmic heavy metal sensor [Alphaproteobacteria bacterium]